LTGEEQHERHKEEEGERRTLERERQSSSSTAKKSMRMRADKNGNTRRRSSCWRTSGMYSCRTNAVMRRASSTRVLVLALQLPLAM
jgi:late competence protein required for DNA uptake (superfamily II DNA/RNA helicase)